MYGTGPPKQTMLLHKHESPGKQGSDTGTPRLSWGSTSSVLCQRKDADSKKGWQEPCEEEDIRTGNMLGT